MLTVSHNAFLFFKNLTGKGPYTDKDLKGGKDSGVTSIPVQVCDDVYALRKWAPDSAQGFRKAKHTEPASEGRCRHSLSATPGEALTQGVCRTIQWKAGRTH